MISLETSVPGAGAGRIPGTLNKQWITGKRCTPRIKNSYNSRRERCISIPHKKFSKTNQQQEQQQPSPLGLQTPANSIFEKKKEGLNAKPLVNASRHASIISSPPHIPHACHPAAHPSNAVVHVVRPTNCLPSPTLRALRRHRPSNPLFLLFLP